jgi:hypothetical protein
MRERYRVEFEPHFEREGKNGLRFDTLPLVPGNVNIFTYYFCFSIQGVRFVVPEMSLKLGAQYFL